MAGSSEDPCRTRRRRRLADLYGGGGQEEVGIVPGYHSDADTAEYYNSNRDCSSDSDETISDSAPAHYGSGSTSPAAASAGTCSAAAALACPLCGKEFRNHKAVCGHMKVHREQGIGKAARGIKRNVPVVVAWGGTAKRGCCSGSRARASSPIPEPVDQSTAVVVAEAKIVLDPMPLAFATPNLPPVPAAIAAPDPSPVTASDSAESSSAQPTRGDAMEAVAARAASPPKEAVVDLHAAPPPPAAGEQAPPVRQQRVAPPPRGRQDPNGYTCSKCNKWFRTHQGLVGHKNREIAAALQGGGAPHSRNAKAGRTHACKVCGAEFPGGIQLGGHMRKHWKGKPFNKKPRRLVQPLPPPGLLTLAHVGSPAPGPAMAGRVLLFGIDIGAGLNLPLLPTCPHRWTPRPPEHTD
ncbi:hypothetical protein GQ55_5G220400 [Panicum hallii var. hallii]|uniref:C2H2-type domain-containing protein n=1 Tax=Panicum hallii var. hallii TaxID=1504633 RepID=A0A2T7DIY3_9POAL|nr:hypothetical protein GQ55_5G220400 [Panicum hallii var. hallii]